MAFRSIIGNPLGQQVVFPTPAFNAILSDTNLTVLTITLPTGLWIVNINNIFATADNNAGGSRLNNYKQTILYGGVAKEQTAFVGISAVSLQASSIAIINCDGITPITIKVDGKTNDAGSWSVDTGDITTTRLY